MDNLFQTTKTHFNRFKSLPNLEIELRLGKKNRNLFDTNLGEEKFKKIKEALDNFQTWEKVIHSNITSYFHKEYRYDYNEDSDEASTIIKKKLIKTDFVLPDQPLDVRLSIAQEIPQPDFNVEDIEMEYVRNKIRTSYIRKNLSLDLTEVTGNPDDMDDESDKSYELEMEIIDISKIKTENDLYNIIYKVFCILKTL
jgi:hypothetical protein